MALAWKAGWVNSPQGFESPILRAIRLIIIGRPRRRLTPLALLTIDLVLSFAVACPSGQRSAPRKRVWGQPHRGFKSHRHRHSTRSALHAGLFSACCLLATPVAGEDFCKRPPTSDLKE